MHNALAHPRLHYPKARIIGVYAPDGPVSLPTKQNEESGAAKKTGSGPVIHPDSCVYVPNPKGQHFRTIGKADRRGRVWLLPEEALYLLERGSLDIRWPCSLVGEEGDDKDGDDEDGPSDLPMSLQAAYTCFIGRGGLALERYSVYTGLRRLGYVVLRAPGWCDEEEESGSEDTATGQGYAVGGGLFAKFWQWFYKSNTTASGPVAGLGIHRSYGVFLPAISVCE